MSNTRDVYHALIGRAATARRASNLAMRAGDTDGFHRHSGADLAYREAAYSLVQRTAKRCDTEEARRSRLPRMWAMVNADVDAEMDYRERTAALLDAYAASGEAIDALPEPVLMRLDKACDVPA